MHSAPDTLPATILSAETIAGDVRLLRIRPEFGFTRAEPGSHLSVALTLGGLDRIRS